MSPLRVLVLVGLLSAPAFAEINSLNANTLPNAVAAASSVVVATPLPAVPSSETKRPLALVLGIALTLLTFQQAFARRQRA